MKLPEGLLQGVAVSFAEDTRLSDAYMVTTCYQIGVRLEGMPDFPQMPRRLETLFHNVSRFGFLYLPLWEQVAEGTPIVLELRHDPFRKNTNGVRIELQAWMISKRAGHEIIKVEEVVLL